MATSREKKPGGAGRVAADDLGRPEAALNARGNELLVVKALP